MKIERLEVFTGNVVEQLKFYRDLLGLPVKNYTEDSFEVQIGYSVLKFTGKEGATPYHIAIHVPDKQEEEALTWVKERVAVLRNNNEEIIDFSGWNAMSVYFYDRDQNIMELISRRDLFKPASAIFTSNSLLGIAEIGLATGDLPQKFNFLNKEYGIEKFDGDLEKFCAAGDDRALIITINKDEKDWFPTRDKAYASAFTLEFTHNDEKHSLQFENDEVRSL